MNTSTHRKISSSFSPSSERSSWSNQNQHLFDATVRYGVRIAQLEGAFELLARGIVRDLRTAVMAAYDLNSFLLGNDYQRFAAVIQGVVYQQITGAWPRLWPILEDGHNRAAALATRYISKALLSGREDEYDSAQDATEEFPERLEDITELGALLTVLSAIQSRRRVLLVVVNGLTLPQFWESLAQNAARRFGTTVSAMASDAQITGSVTGLRDSILNMLSDRPSKPTRFAQLSGQSDTSILASIKKYLGSMVHAIGNDAMQAVSEVNQSAFVGEVHTSILDDVTCPVCRSLNGTFYPYRDGVSTARSLPIHFMCRCKYTPVTSRERESNGVTFGEWFSEQDQVFRGSVFSGDVSRAKTFPDARKMSPIIAQSIPSLRQSSWMSL